MFTSLLRYGAALKIKTNIFSDGENLQAGALLATLRQTRAGLEGQHSVLEQGIRQAQRFYNQQQGNRNNFQQNSYQQNSYQQNSYSRSYSRSSSGRTVEYDDYEDEGPLPNRG